MIFAFYLSFYLYLSQIIIYQSELLKVYFFMAYAS